MKSIFIVAVILLTITTTGLAAVNINTASQAELATLNGIGEVKARAIVDYRLKHGAFKSLADLGRVPGIGEGTIKKISKGATLTGNSGSGSAPVALSTKPIVKNVTMPAAAEKNVDNQVTASINKTTITPMPAAGIPTKPVRTDKPQKNQDGKNR